MYIDEQQQRLAFRIVYCAAPGTQVSTSLDAIHQRLPPDGLAPIRTGYAGSRYVSQMEFAPPNMPAIRGYQVRLLLVGFEAQDATGAPCDLSGFHDVDGVVFVARAATPPPYQSQALHQLAASLAHIGYDLSGFPWVVQLQEGASPEQLSMLIPAANPPMLAADPATGAGVFETLKTVTRSVLIAMKENRLRVSQ